MSYILAVQLASRTQHEPALLHDRVSTEDGGNQGKVGAETETWTLTVTLMATSRATLTASELVLALVLPPVSIAASPQFS